MNTALVEARKAARMTQAELAAKAGVDRTTYVHIEHGARVPSLNNALRIASALGRSVEDLFGHLVPDRESERASA